MFVAGELIDGAPAYNLSLADTPMEALYRATMLHCRTMSRRVLGNNAAQPLNDNWAALLHVDHVLVLII